MLKKNSPFAFICFQVLFILLLAAVTTQSVFADVTFETPRSKIVIGADGQWKSIIDKAANRELCPAKSIPFAQIGTSNPASSVKMQGKNILVEFKGVDTKLIYAVNTSNDWIHFKIAAVKGTRPEKVTYCQVPVNITKYVGPMLNIAWDEKTSVCLMAANMQSTCRPDKKAGKDKAVLQAITQDAPGPALEGAAVALIICPSPAIKTILRDVSHVFDLLTNEGPDGVPSKETVGRNSYFFFLGINETYADKMIEYCKRTNFKQAMIVFHDWAVTAGHIEYDKKKFSKGRESIKAFAKKLNDAGIDLGLHTFISKIGSRDAYVKPVPDKRIWVDLPEITLANDISADQTEIKAAQDLKQWPGSPLSKRRWEGSLKANQMVVINDEIVYYKSIGPEGVFDTFVGCKRGSLGTSKAAHKADDKGVHWGYESSGRFVIDPETDLLDIVTQRMADVVNECNVNMIYFDGSEDVPKTRRDYYSSLAHYKTLKKIIKKPVRHTGGMVEHRMWHSMTTGGTIDVFQHFIRRSIDRGTPVDKLPTVKTHINISVKRAIANTMSLMPSELGWFGIWPKAIYKDHVIDGLQLDDIEYLMVKSLAYDAPISLETSFAQMDKHPLTPEILDIVGFYDPMRMARNVDAQTLEKLKEMNKDFIYVKQGDKGEFVETAEITTVAGSHDIRSWIGQLENGNPVATIWHHDGESVNVMIKDKNVKVTDFYGNEIEVKRPWGNTIIPVGIKRTTLIFDGMPINEACNLIINAKIK